MRHQSYLANKSVYEEASFPFLIYRTGQVSGVQRHDHDFWELVYVYSGEGICVNANESFEFHSHQIILTPPFVMHEFQSHDSGRHEQISLAIYPKFLEKVDVAQVKVGKLLARVEESGKFVIDVPERDVASVEQTLESISQEFLFKQVDFESIISLEIARLLISINRFLFDSQVSFPQFEGLPYVVHEAIKQIELKFHKIKDMTELLSYIKVIINQRYFIRLFKKHVGYSPIQYLNLVRIEKSCSLLYYTSLPIAHVAIDAGYGDLRFFNRQFKRFVGITPKEFRVSAKNDSSIMKNSTRFNFSV